MLRRRYITEPTDIIVDARRNESDAEIIRILHANNRCTHPTYLTKRNAASITNTSGFTSNTIIEDMSCLKYFTALTKIKYWEKFESCTKLKRVVLHDGIVELESRAFYRCSSLIDINIPKSCTILRDYCLGGIPADVKVHEGITHLGDGCLQCGIVDAFVPKSVTNMGREVFRGCSKLKSFAIEEGTPLTEVPGATCYNSTHLEKIHIPEGIIKIGGNALYAVSRNVIKDVYLPSTLEELEGSVFYVSLASHNNVVLPNSLKKVGGNCFYSGIARTSMPPNLESFELGAFNSADWRVVYIPKTLTQMAIGNGDCFSRQRQILSVDPENPVYDSRDNCNAIIETATNKLVLGCYNSIIPEGVVEIGAGAFFYQTIRQNYYILPSTIQVIDSTSFNYTTIWNFVCKAVVPPTFTSTVFATINSALYVPDESVDAYKSAPVWSNYASKIKPISELSM